MGGGGFSMEPDNPLMDLYVLRQARQARPRICFLCPGGDETAYAARFFTAFQKHDCRPTHLSLFKPCTADIEGMLLEQDVIYVGGGNTRSMIALWREWGLDFYLRSAWEAGAVLAGVSAGAICWFEFGLTDSTPSQLNSLPCLGFLEGSCAPHYDGEANRRPSFHHHIAQGRMPSGWGIEDNAALHFRNRTLVAIISSYPGKQCYRVTSRPDGVVEEAVPAQLLSE